MLWLTHSLAAFMGGLVVYLTMTHRWKVDMTDETKRRIKAGVFSIAAGLILVGAGVQAKLTQDASDRYRDQQTCLNAFASDLVDTLNTRVAANSRLDDAKAARDEAADQVIETVALASRVPPEAGKREFSEALERFLTAKAELIRVTREVSAELAQNPYPRKTPEAVCSR